MDRRHGQLGSCQGEAEGLGPVFIGRRILCAGLLLGFGSGARAKTAASNPGERVRLLNLSQRQKLQHTILRRPVIKARPWLLRFLRSLNRLVSRVAERFDRTSGAKGPACLAYLSPEPDHLMRE